MEYTMKKDTIKWLSGETNLLSIPRIVIMIN